MNHKKFLDIEHINTVNVNNFQIGDQIVIQEKIDGANAAIRYDSETNCLVAQSRKNILNESNNLRGFYEFVCSLDKQTIKDALGDDLILFGEWLVPHTVVYPEDCYNHFYAYDVYDTQACAYLNQDKVEEIVRTIGLKYVPVFFKGKFESWDKCMEYVGRTDLGGDYGEGIVIKNESIVKLIEAQKGLRNDDIYEYSNGRTIDFYSRQPFYLKIVSERFKETKPIKKKKQLSPEDIAAAEAYVALAESIVVPARTVKIINKLVDEGILPEQWTNNDMKTIAQNLPKQMYEDCLKEHKEIVDQIPNFSKICSKISMSQARDYMQERIGII